MTIIFLISYYMLIFYVTVKRMINYLCSVEKINMNIDVFYKNVSNPTTITPIINEISQHHTIMTG